MSRIKRLTSGFGSRSSQEPTAPGQPPRNYTQEREATRSGGLSTEDQAWETDRLRRNQDAHEDRDPPDHS
jgi:hypothetical protein